MSKKKQPTDTERIYRVTITVQTKGNSIYATSMNILATSQRNAKLKGLLFAMAENCRVLGIKMNGVQ